MFCGEERERKREIALGMMGSRRLEQEGSDWSGLLPELLELIITRLSSMDYLNCREVCSSWRKAVDDAPNRRRCTPSPIPSLFSLPVDLNQPMLTEMAYCTLGTCGTWQHTLQGLHPTLSVFRIQKDDERFSKVQTECG